MAVREDIIQGVRTWLKSSESLTNAQVIVADTAMQRPPLPYLTVKVISPDGVIGRDELVEGLDGDSLPTSTVRGERRATVSLQGFGAAAEDWLESAMLRRRLPTIQNVLIGVGLTIEPMGAIRDLSRLVDTSIEPRFSLDLEVTYRIESDPASETEALTIEGTYVLGGSPSDLTVTSTVSLTS